MAVSHDPVNNPSHYTQGKVECIDAIEAALGPVGFVCFLRGQIIKYNWRQGLKGPALEDARKAKFYEDRLVATLAAADAPQIQAESLTVHNPKKEENARNKFPVPNPNRPSIHHLYCVCDQCWSNPKL